MCPLVYEAVQPVPNRCCSTLLIERQAQQGGLLWGRGGIGLIRGTAAEVHVEAYTW